MCTRPKLVDIGYMAALQRGDKKPWTYHNYRFCPCGMCIECRNMRREEYTQRLKHEIETSNYVASFVTLTYRDENLPVLLPPDSAYAGSYFRGSPPPYQASLSKSDAKKFCDNLTKRFRRKYGNAPLKYICAGEYGDSDGHRPHLHLIMVGLPASERKMVYDCWGKGRIDIEPVGNGAIRYVLSYIDKQVFGADQLFETYGDYQPPFALFSKGIGKKWIEKNLDKFDNYGKITFGSGKSYTLNPYYRRKYDFDNKQYKTPFSDSVFEWAKAKKMSLYEAYIDRCKIKELEYQRHQVHKREPLYNCTKAILHKEFNILKNKRNVDIYDYAAFTKKYLKKDDSLVFNKSDLRFLLFNDDKKYFTYKKSEDKVNYGYKKLIC